MSFALPALILIACIISFCPAHSIDRPLEDAEPEIANGVSNQDLSETESMTVDASLVDLAADAQVNDADDSVERRWTVKGTIAKAKGIYKDVTTKDKEFKLPTSVLASWRDAGCRSSVGPTCNKVCSFIVSTQSGSSSEPQKFPNSRSPFRRASHELVDITVKLQQAVDDASSSAEHRGLTSCSVILPKGKYTITKSIRVPSRVHIMGNSASIHLPQRSPNYFPAFIFKGAGPIGVPLFKFSNPPPNPIGPGKSIVLPENVGSAIASILANKERVILRVYLLGVPDLKEFLDTQKIILQENYTSTLSEWGKNPVGFMVEVSSIGIIKPSNIQAKIDALIVKHGGRPTRKYRAELRSSLPYQFDKHPFEVQIMPGSKFVTNSALTDLILIRPPVSDADKKIIQANTCAGNGISCQAIKKSFKDMELGNSGMVQLTFTLDVLIARNSMTGIVHSGADFIDTLHTCFHSNVVSNAHVFADTGAGQGDGIILTGYSSYNSVITNSFTTLRHAMLLQNGANSNVIAGNKNDKVRCQMCRPSPQSRTQAQATVDSWISILNSIKQKTYGIIDLTKLIPKIESAWSKITLHDLSLPSSSPAVSTACLDLQHESEQKQFSLFGQNMDWCADISFHGLYSSNNLIEGNDVETIKIADYYGPSPSNVVFGNRINAGTLSVVVDRASKDTVLVDNLFTNGGIHFLDDASSAICIGNKECSNGKCSRLKQPSVKGYKLFSKICSTVDAASKPLDYVASKSADFDKFLKTARNGCEFFDKNTGGTQNKLQCIEDNLIGVQGRPQSLFADSTLKACTNLEPQCFNGMRKPESKHECRTTDLELSSSDLDEIPVTGDDVDVAIDTDPVDNQNINADADIDFDSMLQDDNIDDESDETSA